VFIHGCFWHGHDCELFRLPGTRTKFWRDKIKGNRKRDRSVVKALAGRGWRVLNVWECGFRGRTAPGLDAVVDRIVEWLDSEVGDCDVRGRKKCPS
jgi:DNA mismatch endonuclease (patch repair protein)